MDDEGIPKLLANVNYKLRLFGEYFKNDTLLAFTENGATFNERCTFLAGTHQKVRLL